MTTIQRLKSTRMAPYIGLMQELTPEEKHLVVMFLTEQEEPKTDVVEQVRRKYGVSESEATRWFKEHAKAAQAWDRQEAWNRLTDKQREEATRLKLTAEDMDELTFAMIEKHLR